MSDINTIRIKTVSTTEFEWSGTSARGFAQNTCEGLREAVVEALDAFRAFTRGDGARDGICAVLVQWEDGTRLSAFLFELPQGDIGLHLPTEIPWVLVRTKGRWAGGSGGGDRSWLLIKHRDEWAGDVDITEFAPLSVKSGGDFADILAQDTPDIWQSHRPAEGGEAGAMFAKIIARALELQEARTSKGTAEASAAGTRPAARNAASQATRVSLGRVALARASRSVERNLDMTSLRSD